MEEAAIKKTLAIQIDDNDDKAEIYSYLIDNVYKKYVVKVSIKGVELSSRFKLLLSMIIIGSKRSRLFLFSFHYMTDWQWIKNDEPFFYIMVQLLHHYLISVFDYHIDSHNKNLSHHSKYLTGIIDKVLSRTMLSTFHDIKFKEKVGLLKEKCLEIISSDYPHVLLSELKKDNDLNVFCKLFESWARRIFSLISTSNQYCYDCEKFVVKEDQSVLKYDHEIFDQTSNGIDYEMQIESNCSNDHDDDDGLLISFPINDDTQSMLSKQHYIIAEETKYEEEEVNPVALNTNFGDKITKFFRNIGALMDEDDDSSCNSNF